jgi:hypothetical protein
MLKNHKSLIQPLVDLANSETDKAEVQKLLRTLSN